MRNYRAGIVAAAVYNANPYRKQGRAVAPLEFFGERAEPHVKSADETMAEMVRWTSAVRGKP